MNYPRSFIGTAAKEILYTKQTKFRQSFNKLQFALSIFRKVVLVSIPHLL
jgi:hypothetical protein